MYSWHSMATLLFIGFWCYPRVIKTIKIEVIQEVVDNHAFVHKMEDINGIFKEQWLVDNTPIGHEEFKKHKIEARMRELEREELRALERRKRVFQADYRARRALQKKLLAHILDQVEQQLACISNIHLMPYFMYSSITLSNAEELERIEQEQKKAEDLVDDSESTLNQLQESYVYLESMVSKLQQFFYDSLENAIEHCDDPRLLKEFLELLNNKDEEYK